MKQLQKRALNLFKEILQTYNQTGQGVGSIHPSNPPSDRLSDGFRVQNGSVRINCLGPIGPAISYAAMPNQLSFHYFKTSPEIIELAVMLCVRFPLSLRNVEGLLHECRVDVSYESAWYWWSWFGPKVTSEIKKLLFVAKDRFRDRFFKNAPFTFNKPYRALLSQLMTVSIRLQRNSLG